MVNIRFKRNWKWVLDLGWWTYWTDHWCSNQNMYSWWKDKKPGVEHQKLKIEKWREIIIKEKQKIKEEEENRRT